jgi:CHAD domain-containing protein
VRTDPHQKLPKFAAHVAAARLDRLGYEIGRASKTSDADTVHDLRVAIRRFQSCLKLFRDCFPKAEAKKIRKRLRAIMNLTAAVRDCDIAIGLGLRAELAAESPLLASWRDERNQAAQRLISTLKRATKGNFSDKLRSRLGL